MIIWIQVSVYLYHCFVCKCLCCDTDAMMHESTYTVYVHVAIKPFPRLNLNLAYISKQDLEAASKNELPWSKAISRTTLAEKPLTKKSLTPRVWGNQTKKSQKTSVRPQNHPTIKTIRAEKAHICSLVHSHAMSVWFLCVEATKDPSNWTTIELEDLTLSSWPCSLHLAKNIPIGRRPGQHQPGPPNDCTVVKG